MKFFWSSEINWVEVELKLLLNMKINFNFEFVEEKEKFCNGNDVIKAMASLEKVFIILNF